MKQLDLATDGRKIRDAYKEYVQHNKGVLKRLKLYFSEDLGWWNNFKRTYEKEREGVRPTPLRLLALAGITPRVVGITLTDSAFEDSLIRIDQTMSSEEREIWLFTDCLTEYKRLEHSPYLYTPIYHRLKQTQKSIIVSDTNWKEVDPFRQILFDRTQRFMRLSRTQFYRTIEARLANNEHQKYWRCIVFPESVENLAEYFVQHCSLALWEHLMRCMNLTYDRIFLQFIKANWTRSILLLDQSHVAFESFLANESVGLIPDYIDVTPVVDRASRTLFHATYDHILDAVGKDLIHQRVGIFPLKKACDSLVNKIKATSVQGRVVDLDEANKIPFDPETILKKAHILSKVWQSNNESRSPNTSKTVLSSA